MKLWEILEEKKTYKNIDVVGLNEVSYNYREPYVLTKDVHKVCVDPSNHSIRIYVK